MKEILKKIIVAIITYEARLLLKRTRPKIVAVTGSVGKTSVKDAVYEVLRKKMHVRKSEKSFNSEIGIPLTVLGLQNGWNSPFLWIKNIIDGALCVLHPGNYPELLVLEMGVDRPGDMDANTTWIRPDVVVLTRLPQIPVHVEFFDSPEAVISEKLKLVNALKTDGVLIFNQDDEKVQKAADGILQQSIGYSRYSRSPFMASGDAIVYDDGKAIGYTFTLTHLNDSVYVNIRDSIGVQHTYTSAAAAAVGALFGVSLEEAAIALSSYTSQPGRMRLLRGIKDTLIIDDTYNASPIASEYSLETLKEMKGVKRRIAILGDMMELGHYSIPEHERIGRLAAKSADLLMTIGVRARGYAKGALDEGLSEKKILQFEEPVRAGKELQNLLKAGDVILVKGSQSIRGERLVEEIMAEPERAEELLVRQGEYWKNIP